MSHAFLYVYLLSVPKSAAAQLISLEMCLLPCLGFISVFAVAVYLHLPCHTGALGWQVASQGREGVRGQIEAPRCCRNSDQ